VDDSDDSEVREIVPAPEPSVSIDNVVFAGPGKCVNGTDMASGAKNTNVTYCFTVTNTGALPLKDVTVTNDDIKPLFEDTYADVLAPGESYVLQVPGTIDDSYPNTANVVGTPVVDDGSDLPKVLDSDDSEIQLEGPDGDGRNGVKSPFDDGIFVTDSCMEDNWKQLGQNDSNLICRAKEVTLSNVAAEVKGSCVVGEKIMVDLSASMHMSSGRRDFGWYIATDGGDALTGKCDVKHLEKGSSDYTITDGIVTWSDGDDCGDIDDVDDDGADMTLSLGKMVELTCTDVNKDGFLDFSICFSWRTADMDDVCDPAALYPGDVTKCDCMTYDIPQITVSEPHSHSTCY
jgi:hypothetical protein